MHLLSRFAGRRPFALLVALAGLLVMSTAPASAVTIAASKSSSKLVSAANMQSVIDYLASKGSTVTSEVDGAGGPMLTEANNYYEVYFNCDEAHENCVAIQFRACYADYPDITTDTTNSLGRDYFFPKSYINSEGFACVELPVATGKDGISYEALDVSYDAFINFTGDIDNVFGPGFVESAE